MNIVKILPPLYAKLCLQLSFPLRNQVIYCLCFRIVAFLPVAYPPEEKCTNKIALKHESIVCQIQRTKNDWLVIDLYDSHPQLLTTDYGLTTEVKFWNSKEVRIIKTKRTWNFENNIRVVVQALWSTTKSSRKRTRLRKRTSLTMKGITSHKK